MKRSTSDFTFLRRTVALSLWTCLLFGVAIASRWGWLPGTGFAFGCVWALANFGALGLLLVLATTPGPIPKLRIALVGAAKMAVLAVGFLALFEQWLPVVWFAAGFTWPLVVILLRALGWMWWRHTRDGSDLKADGSA